MEVQATTHSMGFPCEEDPPQFSGPPVFLTSRDAIFEEDPAPSSSGDNPVFGNKKALRERPTRP